MKLKVDNIFSVVAVGFFISGIALIGHCRHSEHLPASKLKAGDLVRHKLHTTWKGIVLWNPIGPEIAVRYHKVGWGVAQFEKGTRVDQNSQDAEWEHQ